MKIAGIFPTRVKQDVELDLSSEQPLGIAYIMASAQKAGHNVSLHYGNPVLEEIANADILALSLLTMDVPVGLEIARKYKERNPFGKVIVGGPHITGDPSLVLENCLDYGVIGEGEETFLELLDSFDAPERVKGIAFVKNGKVIQTERRPRIQNLDGLRPLRDKTFDENKDYSLAYPPTSERRVIPVISLRDCTMACEFCTSPLIWQQKAIYRSPKDVIDEMEELTRDKTKEVYLFDEETLFSNSAKAKELFRNFDGIGYNLSSCGDIRMMDEEMVDLMTRAGYTQVYWGIESIHPEVLAKEKKGSTKDKIRDVLNMCADRGIVNIGMIMIGFDYETEQDILRYAEELPNYNIHQLRVSLATPFPGTSFESRLKQQGIKFNPNLSEWDTGHLSYEHPTIDSDKMEELPRHIIGSFYRSFQWQKRMDDFVSQHPRMNQSVEEFRDYISTQLSKIL